MRDMRKIRGNDIAMIFQEPMTSLNPVFTIGNQIAEAVKLHQHVGDRGGHGTGPSRRSESVGIAAPERRVKQYPHELSGGMRQRVDDRHGPLLRARSCSSPTSRRRPST